MAGSGWTEPDGDKFVRTVHGALQRRGAPRQRPLFGSDPIASASSASSAGLR
jgi:hypothetical protein